MMLRAMTDDTNIPCLMKPIFIPRVSFVDKYCDESNNTLSLTEWPSLAHIYIDPQRGKLEFLHNLLCR